MGDQTIEVDAKNVEPVQEIREGAESEITLEESECMKEVAEVLKKHGCFIAPYIKDGFDPYNPPKWGYQFISEKRIK